MCNTSFITLDDQPDQTCDYLLAKFIIFCVFMGMTMLYVLCSAVVDGMIVMYMLVIAFAFELVAFACAMFYLVVGLYFVGDFLCFLITCLCCCIVCPLVERAQVNNRADRYVHREFMAIWMVGTACAELMFMFRASERVVPVGGDLRPDELPPVRLMDVIKQSSDTVRCVVNIV